MSLGTATLWIRCEDGDLCVSGTPKIASVKTHSTLIRDIFDDFGDISCDSDPDSDGINVSLFVRHTVGLVIDWCLDQKPPSDADIITVIRCADFLGIDSLVRACAQQWAKKIHRLRREMCNPAIGKPPSDEVILAFLVAELQQLDNNLLTILMEELDAVSFAILRHTVHFHRCAYRPQLRRLLHDSPYSLCASENAERAYEAYNAILLAREALLKLEGFHQALEGTGRAADRVVVAPDYRTIVGIWSAEHKATLWKVHREGTLCKIKEVVEVQSAEYIDQNTIALHIFGGEVERWNISLDREHIVTLRDASGFRSSGVSVSARFLLQNQFPHPTLWNWEDHKQPVKVHFSGVRCWRWGKLSPDSGFIVFINLDDHLYITSTELDVEPTRLKRWHDISPSRIWISPKTNAFVTIAHDTVELWRIDALRLDPLVFVRDEQMNKRPWSQVDDYFNTAVFSPCGNLLAVLFCPRHRVPDLHILRISENAIEKLYNSRVDAPRGSSLSWFLDRTLFVGGQVQDLAEVTGAEM